MTPTEFARRVASPTLYHASWPEARERIREDGLLSPLALCERLGLSEDKTREVMTRRRDTITEIAPGVVLNDNKPLQDGPLDRALEGSGLSPDEWRYELNSRVYLFRSRKLAEAFANAAASRDRRRDIWAFDTLDFAREFHNRIEITPFNTGSTVRQPPPRDRRTFARIDGLDYDEWRMRRVRAGYKTTPDTIREICVYHSAPGARGVLVQEG